MLRGFYFSIVSLFLLASCTPKLSSENSRTDRQFGIFSTRPNNRQVVLATVKLQSPALLSALEIDKKTGQKVPSADLLKSITQEQETLKKELAQLSSDIKIIYTYKLVLNAFTIQVPIEYLDQLSQLTGVVRVEQNQNFAPPSVVTQAIASGTVNDFSKNSVKFIGGDKARAQGVTGRGTKVGVIDTGIDYTHSMLGGSGDPAQFKLMDKSKASALFPNKKVVGGYDFVGTEYNAASEDSLKQIPHPDENPMDEGGHGSHVAGSVAGLGDDINTYSGVAPEADLYALKVFGASGSTSDAVVIAAFEWAADPNKDGRLDDHLDVVNLSLGSSYGGAHILYSEAIRNITLGDTVVVASAGNSGAQDYIVGAPGVATEALSVAAGIDDGFHNWQFASSEITLGSEKILVENIEGPITKPIAEFDSAGGRLVYVGLAAQDLNEELAAKVKGQVALIDRGSVAFADKVRRAEQAGAIGVVVANNQPGSPIAMGGDGHYQIPGIMVSQEVGAKIKSALSTQEVAINFKSPEKILKPELIDTITDFSSKGPRSSDSLLKPEITGPGSQIISAAMGEGTKAVKMSGTSMSAPHLAGVMSLMKQKFPQLSVKELKSMVMGTALKIANEGKEYPLSRQGAGRVQVDQALNSVLTSDSPSISLGTVAVNTRKKMALEIPVRNLTNEKQTLRLSWRGHSALKFEMHERVEIPGQGQALIQVKLVIDTQNIASTYAELDGHLQLVRDQQVVFQWPVLAVAQKLSIIESDSFIVSSSSSLDSYGAVAELKVKNKSGHRGDVLPFNLLAVDGRKAFKDEFTSRDCDLQAAGYRIINKEGVEVLQIAVKTFRAMTTWNTCEVSVLLDANGDSIPEQELVGVPAKSLSGGSSQEGFVSYLLDAKVTRDLRKNFEQEFIKNSKATENYRDAILEMSSMKVYDKSTVAIVEAPVSALVKNRLGEIQMVVMLSENGSSPVEQDDFLSKAFKRPFKISVQSEGQPYKNLSDLTDLTHEGRLEFTRGSGSDKLLLLMPMNALRNDQNGLDSQAKVMKPKYQAP